MRASPKLAGRLVGWLVYSGNDLIDNLSPEMGGYRTPFVREQRDGRRQIVTRHLGPEKWSVSLVVATVPAPDVLDDRKLSRLRSNAANPEAVDPDLPDRAISIICEKLRVRFMALKDVLSPAEFKPHDDHLTPAGHRLIADVLRRLHCEERDAFATAR